MTEARFHHVGILVQDFADVERVLGQELGLDVGMAEPEPELGIEILWVDVGGVALELIRPLGPGTPAAAALAAGQGGVHHVALEVADLEGTLERLRAAGIAVRDEQPRVGAHGARIAFIDPAAVEGTLVELVQPMNGPSPGQNENVRAP
jgi:methylmalonyl-CoA/ethylmalonyl-CoA epimerase